MTKFTASEPAPGRSDSVRILRLLWEILFPFHIVRPPKQHALPTLANTHLPPLGPETGAFRPDVDTGRKQSPIAVDVVSVESSSESLAGNAPGDGIAA
jgi:hypothetical protein